MLVEMRDSAVVCYFVVPTVLACTLSACQKWARVEIGPELPDRVRVTEGVPDAGACPKYAPRFEAYTPKVVGDSLAGRATPDTGAVRALIAISDICSLEERRGDPAATTLAIIGGLLGVVVVTALIVGPVVPDFSGFESLGPPQD